MSSYGAPADARAKSQAADEARATLRVLVLGTGAMGSLISARLARSGLADVTMAGTWPAALETVAAKGVTVRETDHAWTIPVRAISRDAVEARSSDLVVVVVKSHQTAQVAPVAARALARGGLVLTMQNGLGNHGKLTELVGADRVVLGVTSMGATLLGPGHVANGGPGRTVFGVDAASRRSRRNLVALFEASGVPIELRGNVDALVWRKLAVNCAINPLSALLGVPNGELLDAPWTAKVMQRTAQEVRAVASALGITLDGDPAAAAFEVARNTAGNRSSMLQDVSRGSRTEIDAINGAVVRQGQRMGVDTPVNEALSDMIRQMEPEAARLDRAFRHALWSTQRVSVVHDRLVAVPAPRRTGVAVNMVES